MPKPMRRWVIIGAVGVLCGLLDGGVFYALTGSVVLGVIVGVPTAAILVVLGVVGARQREGSDAAHAAYEARRARQRRALTAANERRPEHTTET
ncbi:MAG TPA: hypothetical protein VMN58_02295 [Acidimicrobiales bacterium]|nr:hypothetical protein [Acidimicrobiales bacterium]